jgi:hypothetical protein
MFLDAAEASGCDVELCREARAAVDRFQHLLDSFPGGRSALDALISDSAVEVRQRAERTAKQAVYKAMSLLLGFQCETISSALILQPSADGQAVDGIDVSRREGMRRLRASSPVTVFSIGVVTEERDRSAPYLEPLGSDRDATHPMAFFVPQFCDPPTPALDRFEADGHTVFALSSATSSLHSPATITSALIVRRGWPPYHPEGEEEIGRTYLLHYPCKLLIRDLYIRDDLYVGAEPRIRLEFPSPVGPAKPRSSNWPDRLNTLDISAPIEHLGMGLGHAAALGAAAHARLLDHAFETAGWDPSRFRGYRTRIVYPVPMITMGWWIPVPQKH